MENEIIKWGDSVESAVALALEEMQLTRDDVEIEVLEQPSRGFLGLVGAKLAQVKVIRKVPVVKPEPEKAKEVKKPAVQSKPAKKPAHQGNKNSKPKKERKERNRHREEEHSEPALPAVDMSSLSDVPEDSAGLVFIRNLIKEMGIDVGVTGKTDGEDFYFFIEGKDAGTIIGKRGATLDAIQYLVSLKVNKGESEYIRVVVDAENYRAKREKALERLAKRQAERVIRTKRSYKFEPMNPYERKVIHATLQKDGRVFTRSEGQDPGRRVIIELK